MKDETARELVRSMAKDELPVPAWSKVKLRASFDEEFASRGASFAALHWVELAVYAGVGIAIAALALWGVIAYLG